MYLRAWKSKVNGKMFVTSPNSQTVTTVCSSCLSGLHLDNVTAMICPTVCWEVTEQRLVRNLQLATEIFSTSLVSSVKPLAIVARNDSTNCSVSALLRHSERISIGFFLCIKSGHGPNKMAADVRGCRRERNKRGVVIESQPCSGAPLKRHQSQTFCAFCVAFAIKKLRGLRSLLRRWAKDLNLSQPSKWPVMRFQISALFFQKQKSMSVKIISFWTHFPAVLFISSYFRHCRRLYRRFVLKKFASYTKKCINKFSLCTSLPTCNVGFVLRGCQERRIFFSFFPGMTDTASASAKEAESLGGPRWLAVSRQGHDGEGRRGTGSVARSHGINLDHEGCLCPLLTF